MTISDLNIIRCLDIFPQDLSALSLALNQPIRPIQLAEVAKSIKVHFNQTLKRYSLYLI